MNQKCKNTCNASKMSNISVQLRKRLMTQYFVFAYLYKQPGQLEGRFVVDLARRLPTYAKQRFLDYLNDRFVCTRNSTFDSLMDFVVLEERFKE